MKGPFGIWLALCLLLTGCDGLPRAREMGDMALLRTLGVDVGEEGPSVTVSTGPQARGLQGQNEPALTLTAEGESLSAAALELQGRSDRYVFFGYADQLLLGEGLAREDVRPVLDWFARDGELGLGAQLWVIRGNTARAAVESGGERGVEGRLSTLRTDGRLGVAAIPRTAGEVYADLLEWGSAYAPALVLGGEEGKDLMDGGYAVFKGGALVGFLRDESARGLEILVGRPALDTVELDEVVVRLTGGSVRCRFQPYGTLALTVRVEGQLAEYDRPLSRPQLEELSGQIARREEACVRAALTSLRGWRTDCAGLGPRAGLTAPGLWSALEEEWEGTFSRREPILRMEVDLHS